MHILPLTFALPEEAETSMLSLSVSFFTFTPTCFFSPFPYIPHLWHLCDRREQSILPPPFSFFTYTPTSFLLTFMWVEPVTCSALPHPHKGGEARHTARLPAGTVLGIESASCDSPFRVQLSKSSPRVKFYIHSFIYISGGGWTGEKNQAVNKYACRYFISTCGLVQRGWWAGRGE